jgi:hypothetical protein
MAYQVLAIEGKFSLDRDSCSGDIPSVWYPQVDLNAATGRRGNVQHCAQHRSPLSHTFDAKMSRETFARDGETAPVVAYRHLQI